MPLLVLVAISFAVAGLVTLIGLYVLSATGGQPLSVGAGVTVGEELRRHARLRALLRRRFDPSVASGLALALAAIAVVGGGLLLGILAYLVRGQSGIVHLDSSVAQWAYDQRGLVSTHGLNAVTKLGETYTVVGLAVVLVFAEIRRVPSRWILPFVIAVIVGDKLITAAVKDLVARVRPTLEPAAQALGAAFPSGHTSTAAAFYACAALLLARRRGRLARAGLAGAAVGISVAVACSRVFLDLHWLSDVIGGLALGWGWFAACSIAFGGRLLLFGAPARVAARVGGLASPASPATEPAPSNRREGDQLRL
jgi:undecaprenyl-diphosphatase